MKGDREGRIGTWPGWAGCSLQGDRSFRGKTTCPLPNRGVELAEEEDGQMEGRGRGEALRPGPLREDTAAQLSEATFQNLDLKTEGQGRNQLHLWSSPSWSHDKTSG